MIYQLWKAGELNKAIEYGIIKPHIPKYCQICEEYLKHRESGENYLQAIESTADKMCVSSDTVVRAMSHVMQ
jgi:hypothetical protein